MAVSEFGTTSAGSSLSDFGGEYGVEAFGRTKASDKRRKEAYARQMQGLGELRRGYDEAKGYWRPQYDYGQNALSRFSKWEQDPDAITSDPSYKWRVSQGQEGIENSAAARGGALSGNALRAIEDYRQGAASQEYGNEFQRWMEKLGLGERATGAMSGLAERGGVSAGNMLAGIGQQDFMNFQNIQQQGRQDMQAQNEVLSDWFSNIFGGGMGGG